MNVTEILNVDRAHVWHPYASMTAPPPVECAVSASGTEIQLSDGSRLLDGISNWWCMAHGHNHPAITEAVRKQSEKLSHIMFAGFTHEPAAELADALTRVLPEGLNRIFYADSGSIAVEVAAKMAVQYQHAQGRAARCRLAALRGGYHGDTVGAMALSDPDGMHTLFRGMLPPHVFLPRPECRFGNSWQVEYFTPLAQTLEPHVEEIAAVICEPVFQGANGMWMYHPGYLRELRKFCSEHDILLILDEIATGFCRTGAFFAMDYAGIVPDVVCLGKSLTGGCLTLAAAAASERVAATIGTDTFCNGALIHGPTFMANPLACAAGVASLKLFECSDYLPRIREMEALLKTGLAPLRELENVRDVRVLGAVGALEVEKIPAPARTHEIIRQTGVWLRPYGNFIYSMPPFIATNAEVARIIEAISALARG